MKTNLADEIFIYLSIYLLVLIIGLFIIKFINLC